MFRWTAPSCRALAGTFALLGCSVPALAYQSSSVPLPSTSLGKPEAPPAAGSKATKRAATMPAAPTPSPIPSNAGPSNAGPALPASEQPALGDPNSPQSAPAVPAIPGLGNLMTPNGIALPGGVGFIRPGADSVGVQINTPNGPMEFAVPRRHRRSRRDEGPAPTPQGTTDAPLFGQPGTPAPAPQASVSGPAQENDRPLPGESKPSDNGRSTRGSREFAHASRLFHARNYPATLRRLDRALARDPGDRDLLQLRSLTQLALGDFKSAYADAVVVLAQDDVWDWSTLRSLYHSADEYTALYRSLEDRVIAHPNALDLRILLGYHNLVLGHRDAASRHFERVLALDPSNEVARRMVAAEQPPQPRTESVPVPSRSTGPGALVPIPSRSRSRTSAAPATGGPVSIDLGQPTPSSPAPQKPADPKSGG
ncbi:MAG TPA: hypothetical protein VGP63_30380 [Planctomycetaceae bacterium]|nr:hypothetical protein [Planctomycetaceae bacterium]